LVILDSLAVYTAPSPGMSLVLHPTVELKLWSVMMKVSLTILAGVWVAVSFGQPLADISKRLKALEQQTTFYHDTAGFFKLPRFDYRCDNGNEHPWDYYHIMDVNRDGHKD